MPRGLLICALFGLTGLLGRSVEAQGLLWKLPAEDGTWVKYAGTYENLEERPKSNEGPLSIKKRWELTIKSVGNDTIDVDGESIPCRWIEFKSVMGDESAEGVQPGPYGTRIYKVLVREDQIQGKLIVDDIPVTHIPIVKGFRKHGELPAEPLKEKILTVYPLLSSFGYYPNFEPAADDAEDAALPAEVGTVATKVYTGKETVESTLARATNEGKIWLTDDLAFGWARYSVKIVREHKDNTQPRTEFEKTAELNVDMKAVEVGNNAMTELGDAPEAEMEAPAEEPAEAPAEEPAAAPEESAEETE